MTTAIAAIVALIVLMVGILWHVASEAQRHERVSAQYKLRLHRCQELIDNQRTEITQAQSEVTHIRAALVAAKLDRDLRRPGSPIVAYLARRGPATTGELTAHFGDEVTEKLVKLMERQEVTCEDASGHWRWVTPAERVLGRQDDPTTTITPATWSTRFHEKPPPPEHRRPPVLEVA